LDHLRQVLLHRRAVQLRNFSVRKSFDAKLMANVVDARCEPRPSDCHGAPKQLAVCHGGTMQQAVPPVYGAAAPVGRGIGY
jgi:hypothetical protein